MTVHDAMHDTRWLPESSTALPYSADERLDGQLIGDVADDEEATPIRPVLRFVLGCWDVLVWVFLVAIPGVWQCVSFAGFALHFPYVLIGLVILGGVWYALRALADGHLLWFSTVLFLLGTWM